MKLFMVLTCLTVAWAAPLQQENLNLQELDVIPSDDSIDSIAEAAYLPQMIEVSDVLKEYEGANARSDAESVPEIEPLNGPAINEDSLEDGFEPDSEMLNNEDEDTIEVAVPLGNDEDKSAVDELQIVDLDNSDLRGIMGIAPSELDSLRVYFDDDMARELAEDQPAEIKINYEDPTLR